MGGGFVHQDELRARQECAGQGQPLALATGEAAPTLEHRCLELCWETGDFIGDVRLLQNAPQVFLAGIGVGDAQVVADGAVEHGRVLFQQPEPAAVLSEGDAANVVTLPAHRAGVRVVEAA
ncbi:Uncharacterised protein [Mycobacterium tuberculosis]|nr:Uncharacterised protein [Mycobacterium tuberculosis]